MTPVQQSLINAVVETYSLALAADAVGGVSYAKAREWLSTDKAFKAAYEGAMREARDRLLGALYAMAKGDGTDECRGNPSAAAALIKMSGGGNQSEGAGSPKPLKPDLMGLNVVENSDD